MDKVTVYPLLAAALAPWLSAPAEQVRALAGSEPRRDEIWVGGEPATLQLSFVRAAPRRDEVKVTAEILGPSSWRLQRFEQSIVV